MKCALILLALCASSAAAGKVLRGAKEKPVDRTSPQELIAKFNKALPGLLPKGSGATKGVVAAASEFGNDLVKLDGPTSPFTFHTTYADKVQLDEAKKDLVMYLTAMYAEAELMKAETTGEEKDVETQKKELRTLSQKVDETVEDMVKTGLIRMQETHSAEYDEYLRKKRAMEARVKEDLEMKKLSKHGHRRGLHYDVSAYQPGGRIYEKHQKAKKARRAEKRMWTRWGKEVPNVRLSAITNLFYPNIRFNLMVREIFDSFDKNHDAMLNMEEYNDLERLVDGESGVFPSEEEFKVLTDAVDEMAETHGGSKKGPPSLSFNQVNELYLNPSIQEKFNTQLARDYFPLLKEEKVPGRAIQPDASKKNDARELALLTMVGKTNAKDLSEVPLMDAASLRREMGSNMLKQASSMMA